jgi:hypothetical protein
MTKLGVVRMRTGQPDEAIALFRRAIEREPKNESLLPGRRLASTGRPAEACPSSTGRSTPAAHGDDAQRLALARLAVGTAGGHRGLPPVAHIDPPARGRPRSPGSVGAGLG